jgi:membrane fusion protein (multidrug efflux system)
MKSLYIKSLGLLILLALAYYLFYPTSGIQENADIKVVEVEKVSFGNIMQTIRLIGTIKAKRTSILIAKTAGTLDHVVEAGQHAPKETLIAKLENTDLEQAHKLAANAENIAKAQYDRAVLLAKSSHASQQTVEEKRSLWIKAQEALATANIKLDETRFVAPFDGIVGAFKIREGTQVQPGNQIVAFYDPSELIIEFDIPAPFLDNVTSGQKVIVNKQTLTLTHVQKMIDPDTHMSPAFLDFSCPTCVIGTNVDLDLVTVERQKVLTIPFEAVFLRGGKDFVYVARENKASLAPVTLGIREKEHVEVVEGLSEGDLVIVQGQTRLYPEAVVKIADDKESAQSAPAQ